MTFMEVFTKAYELAMTDVNEYEEMSIETDPIEVDELICSYEERIREGEIFD